MSTALSSGIISVPLTFTVSITFSCAVSRSFSRLAAALLPACSAASLFSSALSAACSALFLSSLHASTQYSSTLYSLLDSITPSPNTCGYTSMIKSAETISSLLSPNNTSSHVTLPVAAIVCEVTS